MAFETILGWICFFVKTNYLLFYSKISSLFLTKLGQNRFYVKSPNMKAVYLPTNINLYTIEYHFRSFLFWMSHIINSIATNIILNRVEIANWGEQFVAGYLFLFESENKYNLDFNFNLISDLYPFIGIISEYLSFFLSALEINSYHFYQHFLISFWNWVGLFKADFLILWVQFTNHSYRYAKYSRSFDTLCYNKDFVLSVIVLSVITLVKS